MRRNLKGVIALWATGPAIATLWMGTPSAPARALPAVLRESAQDDEDDGAALAAVKKSGIAPIKLPEGTLLFTGKKQTASLIETLEKFAKQSKIAIGASEVLVWQTDESVHKGFAAAAEEAGYRYKAQPTLESEDGKITLFNCVPEEKGGKKSELFGFWGSNGNTLLLTWGVVKPSGKDTEASAGKQEPSPISSSGAKATAGENERPASDGRKGGVPADLMGDWSWTTISGVNYQNTTTHQLAEPSGLSAKFTFTKDGRYKKFFYIRQRTYSLVTESTTTEEGTVTFGDGTFTLHPEKGYYKGHIGTRIVDRPMTAQERKATTYYWEWRNEDGKRRLYMGPSAQSLSRFLPAK